jgi:phenylacetate-CoA ligase
MGLKEKIYDNLPIFAQNIVVSLSGYSRNRSRYGPIYREHRKFLVNFDKLSIKDKLEYQTSELIKLVNYAYNNSVFYKNHYKDVDLTQIKSIDDLKLLPIVTKEDLRSNIDKIVTIPRRKGVEGHTGGTTGKSLVVIFRKEDMMKRMAMLDHFKSRVGFEHLKMRRATFNGKHIVPPKQKKKIFWRYNRACKQMIYSSFHISDENMIYYINSLNKFKPESIDGFFMSICDLANYIERNNIALSFKPLAIFPTSETLTTVGRELIERVFKCKVYDQYASSEGAPFITECDNQTLHIELSTGVFEQFNDDNEVLITSFTTYGTPLIRYQIGDSVKVSSLNNCLCGMDSPKVDFIQGRTLDFVYTAEKVKINGGNIANLFKNMPNALIRSQVVQNHIGLVDIYLEVDKNKYKDEFDELLKAEFNHKFGSTTQVIIHHVDSIPRENSGKFKFIKNNVSISIEDV